MRWFPFPQMSTDVRWTPPLLTYQWATTRVQEILGAPDPDPVVAPGSGAGGGSGGHPGGARRPLKPGGSSDTPYPKPSPPTGPKAAPAPGGDKGRGER